MESKPDRASDPNDKCGLIAMVGVGLKSDTFALMDRWCPAADRDAQRAETAAFEKKLLDGFKEPIVKDYMQKNNDWISRDLKSLKRGLALAEAK